MRGRLERESLLFEEECIHGSLTILYGKIKDPKNQLRKMEENVTKISS